MLAVARVLLLGALGLDLRGHGVVGALCGGRQLGDSCRHVVEHRLHVLDRLVDDILVRRNEGNHRSGRDRRLLGVLVLVLVLVFVLVLVLRGRGSRCRRVRRRLGVFVLVLDLASLAKVGAVLELLVRRGPDLLELRAGIGHLATGVDCQLGRRLGVACVPFEIARVVSELFELIAEAHPLRVKFVNGLVPCVRESAAGRRFVSGRRGARAAAEGRR